MPRKAAAPTDSEPRRSTRIKDLPKPYLPKKATKPRAKKVEGEAPKRGKKRAAEDTNGAEPAAKKAKAATKPASKASVKQASVKPASRAGSKKPASKVESADKADGAQVPATIPEEET